MLNKISFKENRLIFFQKPSEGVQDTTDSLKDDVPNLKDLKFSLSDNEFVRIRDKKISIDDLAGEKKLVDTEIKHLLQKADRDSTLSPKEIGDLLNELDKNISPDAARKKKEEIEERISTKSEENENNSQELTMEHPDIQDQHQKFHNLLSDNTHLIGTKQKDSFDQWFHQELSKQCTIKNAQDLLRRFEGIDSTDQGGLYPRRQKYNELATIFKNWGLRAPEKESNYIAREGLSERTDFHKNAIQQAYQLRTSNSMFYSQKTKEGIMQQTLTADNPSEQQRLINLQKQASNKESQGFVAFQNTIRVGGMSVRIMSQKFTDTILTSYQNITDLNKRIEAATFWPGVVEAEGKLYQKLENVFGEDTAGLRYALQSFQDMDYMSKEAAIKSYEKDIEGGTSKESFHKKLIIQGAHSKIDAAGRKKTISSQTQEKYKVWFSDPSNHRDPETRKPGSLKQMDKHLKMLTSDTPDEKAKNLKAYEVKREHFKDHVKELKDLSPDLDSSELKNWQDRYDKAGWHDRENIHIELEGAINAQKSVNKEGKKAEETAQITTAEKNESREVSPEMKDLLVLLSQCESEDTYESIREGYLAIFNYKTAMIQENGPEHKFSQVFLHNESKFARLLKEKEGSATGEVDESTIKDAVDRKLQSDEAKDLLDESAIEEINEEESRKNTERLGELDAQERSKIEELTSMDESSEEARITEAFYEMDGQNQGGADHYIKDGEAAEMTTVNLDDSSTDKRYNFSQKEDIRDHQAEMTDKKGFSHVAITDKQGKEITSKTERKAKVESRTDENLEDLSKEVVAEQGVRERAKGNNFDATSTQIAAKRVLHQAKKDRKRKIPQES